ncbi:hypothetical protein [Rhizobium sullae]|nr:hypothetical protein [Rhizobium sullae]
MPLRLSSLTRGRGCAAFRPELVAGCVSVYPSSKSGKLYSIPLDELDAWDEKTTVRCRASKESQSLTCTTDPKRPLLDAAIEWNHAVLHAASERLFEGSVEGNVSVKLAAIADWIENRDPHTVLLSGNVKVEQADIALKRAVSAAEVSEPLACLFRLLTLDPIEIRVFLSRIRTGIRSALPALDFAAAGRFQPTRGSPRPVRWTFRNCRAYRVGWPAVVLAAVRHGGRRGS